MDRKEFLDRVSMALCGRSRSESMEKDRCVGCGGLVNGFKNDLSEKEYTISGLCQTCQDEVFSASVGEDEP